MAPTLAPDALSLAEQAVFAKAITATSVSEVVGRYTGSSTTGLATRIRSRHILHADNAAAVTALAHDLAAFGPLRVRLHRFTHQGRSYQNVEAVLPDRGAPPGRPGAVIISAHVDSTGARQPGYRAATDAAPGADDDASGVAGVLVAAQAVCLLAESAAATPRRPIRFLLFNAEEHGLVGSRAYARDQSALGAPIAAVFQLDMVGWDAIAGRSWELHAGFGPSPAIETASVALANVVSGAAGLVSRTLPTPQIFAGQEADPAEARSDHYSFQVVGYPACLASEDFFVGPGPATTSDGNPNYHMPGDTAIKAEYTADIVRAVAAAAWLTATR